MALDFTWDTHNKLSQGDIPVPWDGGETGREPGQKSVFELRFRTNPGDPWGAPTIKIIESPNAFSYEPPADGWLQVIAYSIRDGLVSWQGVVHEFFCVGGSIYTPGTRITDAGDRRITDAGDARVTE